MSPPSISGHDNYFAIFTSSFIAGLIEPLIFHPMDTVTKRLMITSYNINNYNTFKSNVLSRSIYDGLSYALVFKIFQRVYKFGGQPIANEIIWNSVGPYLSNKYGKKKSKPLVNAFTGAIIGAGEILLTPFDLLKIKMQTNPSALHGKELISLFRSELPHLFVGLNWTLARNIPGSFFLFGGNAYMKEYVFKLDNYKDATLKQNAMSSAVGGILSITISSPLDVIKTRVQKANFGEQESGFKIARTMLKEEGISSFFKGMAPKLLMVGPRLIFSFTVAQSLIPVIEKLL